MRILLTIAALAAMTGSGQAQSAPTAGIPKSYSDATANFAGAGKPGEWTSQARDYANTRFSPLKEITPDNVGKLKVAWTFSDGTQYGHEGAPLVVGDTMYVVSPYPNTAYALIFRSGTFDQVEVRPQSFPPGNWQGLLRCRSSGLGLCRR
ncbi:hypothetical protein [Mesorhizobium sp. INR15]|uniref:hypothetical protein n=1 Tax=Mesorhizobium sp. INR15 TaxID=2654248 RepID=UPI0018965C05|nr:hypothetical protein [Mesorhizobium sp. INR15]QPC95996.1 hypothetical protein GA829_36500 [Mesorhizobium sp. INR15]